MPRVPLPGCPALATTTSSSTSSGPSKTPPLPQPLLPALSQHLHGVLGQPIALSQFNSPPAGFEGTVLYCLFPKPGRGAEGWQLLCLGSLPVRGPGLETGHLAPCPLCPHITPSSAHLPPRCHLGVWGLGVPPEVSYLPPSPTPGRPPTKPAATVYSARDPWRQKTASESAGSKGNKAAPLSLLGSFCSCVSSPLVGASASPPLGVVWSLTLQGALWPALWVGKATAPAWAAAGPDLAATGPDLAATTGVAFWGKGCVRARALPSGFSSNT